MVVQWCLSGIPRKLSDQIKREAYLTEELIIKREAERASRKRFSVRREGREGRESYRNSNGENNRSKANSVINDVSGDQVVLLSNTDNNDSLTRRRSQFSEFSVDL